MSLNENNGYIKSKKPLSLPNLNYYRPKLINQKNKLFILFLFV